MPSAASAQPNPQLIPLPMAAPGSLGLNLQAQNAILPPDWSIESLNTVIDPLGRVAARLGRTTLTTTPAAGPIRSVFEYRDSLGNTSPVLGYDGGISDSTSAPGSSSLVGTVSSVSNGRWYFQNFLDAAIGLQKGHPVIAMTALTGTFSDVAGSPTGGVGTAAYGRLWVMDADGHTLRYCALTDYTNWTTGDSGSIDMHEVWPQGTDVVKGIAGWNGSLVIFGTRQIVLYGSTDPTVLGLDVTALEVVDVIEGTGLVSQWTLAAVGAEVESSDLLFCSNIGVTSLQRLLVNRSRPIQQLTKNVRDALIQQLSKETTDNISGFYSPTSGFYALSLPVSGYTWILDMRHRFTDQDGDDVARVTRWPIAMRSMIEMSNRNVLFAATEANVVQQYIAGADDNASYQVQVRLPWLDFGDNVASRLKALKRVGGIIYATSTIPVTFSWFIDFQTDAMTGTTPTAGSVASEFGIAEFGIDEYSGGLSLNILNVPGSGTGQYYSLAVTANTASGFAIQQLNMMAKLLRMA